MTGTVPVTGATGTVGRHVVAALTDRDCTVRSGVSDPERAPDAIAAAGDAVAFGFAKQDCANEFRADSLSNDVTT